MKSRTLLLGLFAFLFLCTGGLPAQQAAPAKEQAAAPDKEKESDIARLLEITGARKIGVQMVDQMMQAMEQTSQSMIKGDENSRKFMARFREELLKELEADDLSKLIVPVYDRAFSRDEIRGLIQFYESPLGRKMIKTLPQVVQESMAVGQQWGQKHVYLVFTRLADEFPELKEALKNLPPQKP